MRLHRLAHVLLTILVLACAVCASRAGASDDSPPATTVLRVPLNDTLTPGNLARLTANSATARDLLARIERIPDAVLIVRAHPLLVRTERLLGRGQFWVVKGRLFGLLEYQAEPAGSERALRIVAHELAHALEVGMLPRGETEALRSLLRVRELDEGFDLAPGIETDFARAVSHRVHLEMRGRLPNTPGLLAQAAAAHVTLPALPGEEVAGGR